MSTSSPAVRPAESTATTADGDRRPAAWPRLLSICVLLTGLMFVQDPGRIATDTKLDLTANPLSFLMRALHLWEPQGFFGQVQNQAYGYLFPMGPFFGLGDLLGLPDWVVQRLWWSLLLCLAFVGVERLATVLGIGAPWSRLLAGLLYALSPRMLTVLGPSSVEVLPMAIAPWVVLPLVHGSRGGSPRRAAALSGLAMLAVGGVNAVASAIAAIPAALYLLTRSSGVRSRRLVGWWLLAVGLATAWWVLPLLLLGRYSPPFLDWIESASVTTSVTSVAAAVRGVSQWVAYLTTPAGPELRAGWQLITLPAAILHTMVVAGLGLLGLGLPRMRERLWLVSGVLVGLVLVTMGHLGAFEGGLAEPLRAALDGALAPFRNTHKFDLVLRLPLALGSAHAMTWCAAVLTRRTQAGRLMVPAVVRFSAVGVLAVVVLGATAPITTGRLVPAGSYQAIPGYWTEVSDWLTEHRAAGTALVVPGASFGTYVWGRTRDEPLQALTGAPWAVRDAVPLTPAGTIRALDAVQRRLASGQGSPGLTAMLARMGVAYLVVRNDLDPVSAQAPRPVLVHAALDASPGLTEVAAFGPTLESGSTPDVRIDQDLGSSFPAVQVYSVEGVQPVASLVPETEVIQVVGGPESLLDLSDRGLSPTRPVVFAGDHTGIGGRVTIVTDGMRRREVNFGSVDHNASFTLTTSDPLRRDAPARDYLPFNGLETVGRWLGVADVSSSSSAGDADTVGGTRPEHQPAAALDGDPATAWWSSGNHGAVGEWLELRFSHPVDLDGASVTVAGDASATVPSRIAVTTDSGRVQQAVTPGTPVPLTVAGASSRLRLTLTDTADGGVGHSFAIAELDIPGVSPAHTLDVPGVGTSARLTVADGATRGCVDDGGTWLCAADLARAGEEPRLDRVLRLDPQVAYRLTASVVPRPGPALDELLDRQWRGVRVSATSSAVTDPAARPQTVVDGDLGTGWTASAADASPTLTVRLPERRSISGISVRLAPRLAATRPETVVVSSSAGERVGSLDTSGSVQFAPLVTSELTVRLASTHPVATYDPVTGAWRTLPLGVSELGLLGASDLTRPPSATGTVVVPCAEGPRVQVGDQVVETTLQTSVEQLITGQPVLLHECDPAAPTTGGLVRVQMEPTPLWLPRSVDLIAPSDPTGEPVADAPVAVTRWDATVRSLRIPQRGEPSLLVVRQNTNAGWIATYAGEPLPPVVVDGWQQGWRVPSGASGVVTLEYRPDTQYRWALVGGVGALFVLVLLALVRGRDQAGPVGPAGWPPWVVAALGLGGLWLLAGGFGLVVGAVSMVVAWGVSERLAGLLGWAAGALVLAAAVLLARGPWGTLTYAGDDALPQALCLVAVSVSVGLTTRWVRRPPLHGHQ